MKLNLFPFGTISSNNRNTVSGPFKTAQYTMKMNRRK